MIAPYIPSFKKVWAIDFEFQSTDGNNPIPVCMVATELISGQTYSLFGDDLRLYDCFPFGNVEEDLFVAFYSSAEWGCFIALHWKLPCNVIDLYVEYSNVTCNKPRPYGRGLVGVMLHFGLDFIDYVEKTEMRNLVLRGGPYSETNKNDILQYCKTDVDALGKLYPIIISQVSIPQALIRGRFTVAAALIETNGIPINQDTYFRVKNNASALEQHLIREVDKSYSVFENSTFKYNRFEQYINSNGFNWPRLPSGKLDLQDDTFKRLADIYPEIGPLRQLRQALAQLRTLDIPVGIDGRNRCLLSVFSSKTGRNQPSNSRYIFGMPSWMRGLIKPEAGTALAYLDYGQQEHGIAAALSGDQKMMEAYLSGDPYLAFAKQAGAVPEDGTKSTHPRQRELFKSCSLAVQYGMGADSLALRINEPHAKAQYLLDMHRDTYRRFWEWSDAVVTSIQLQGKIQTVFGWNLHYSEDINPRMVRNFPMQGNGSEMLRLACILCCERGIKVCAPVHDAILIESPLCSIDETVKNAMACMAEASRTILNGFELRTDAKITCNPDRFMDERGQEFWNLVMITLDKIEFNAA